MPRRGDRSWSLASSAHDPLPAPAQHRPGLADGDHRPGDQHGAGADRRAERLAGLGQRRAPRRWRRPAGARRVTRSAPKTSRATTASSAAGIARCGGVLGADDVGEVRLERREQRPRRPCRPSRRPRRSAARRRRSPRAPRPSASAPCGLWAASSTIVGLRPDDLEPARRGDLGERRRAPASSSRGVVAEERLDRGQRDGGVLRLVRAVQRQEDARRSAPGAPAATAPGRRRPAPARRRRTPGPRGPRVAPTSAHRAEQHLGRPRAAARRARRSRRA